jgi:uncharacterized protein YceK
MRLLVISLVTVALLSGCSYARRADRAKVAERAQTELVGLTKTELLTCAGIPPRAVIEEGLEFMSYPSSKYGWGGGCLVTFVLQDGLVESVNYSGRTGRYSQNGEQCAYAVQGCLPAAND